MKIRMTTKREERKFIKLFEKLTNMRLPRGFGITYCPNGEIAITRYTKYFESLEDEIRAWVETMRKEKKNG